MDPTEPRISVLVVDDEPGIQRTLLTLFEMSGLEARAAGDGREALGLLESFAPDVIVSDISMPDLDGIRLLREVRRRDLDLPVVLVTGLPSVESAAHAVELGAHRYITKPFDHGELLATVKNAASIYRTARLQRKALSQLGLLAEGASDRAGLEARFGAALESVALYYQPIFPSAGGPPVGFEALLRTRSTDLPDVGALLDAAHRLGRVRDVGRRVRKLAPEPLLGRSELLFLNLCPEDLSDPDLFDRGTGLEGIAHRVVLEITERDRLEGVAAVTRVASELRARGYRIAVDDLGAGYSGLNNLATLRPEFVKIDMSLVRGVDADPVRQKLVRALCAVSHDLGSSVVGEGVETVPERDALVAMGVDLLQGFLLGRPEPWAPGRPG